ncbi:alpha-amylase family glycosyl hydrolase [Halobacteriaceae archaeon SHR40]|uniref:alpha-amylase family glycosyl hydrolase n=1 Tax=Halovenus amylolytica TaxID=2500550 RepID=UPI000FE31C3E
MHHPGPPRVLAVGETQELAPRDPDPDGTYSWHVAEAPERSAVSFGDDPVESFTPDRPGVYTVALDAPDGRHELTLRVFPSEMAVAAGGGASGQSGRSGMSGPGESGVSGKSGSGLGSAREDPVSGGGRPRLTLTGERAGDEVVLTAHAQTAPNGDEEDESLDVEFYVDDRDELTEYEVDGRELHIPLDVLDAPVRIHAVAFGTQYSVPDTVRVHSGGDVELLNEPPEWGKEMTLYEIYVRGYIDPDEGQSTFDAIAENLDHIQRLGINTLWLTPVLQNDDFDHGYNTTDFFSIADDLGGEEAFRNFVQEVHDRDMRILFDLVLNHSARDHEFFQKAVEGHEKYIEWYDWQDRENRQPETYFDWPYIANFNYRNLEVRRHLLDAVEKWADLVDGFRCDMAWAVPKPFWQEVRSVVKDHDSEFLLMDETIPYVADFHNLCFDIHFDAGLYFDLIQIGGGEKPAEQLYQSLENRYRIGFPNHAGFLTYIENHDEDRYVETPGRHAVEAAATASLTLPGAPMIYAGQEIGEHWGRGKIHWDDADEDLLAFYQQLGRVREEFDALGYRADFEEVQVESTSENVVAYARENDDERVVVVLNFGHEPEEVGLSGERIQATDRLSGENVAAEEGVYVENAVILPAERTVAPDRLGGESVAAGGGVSVDKAASLPTAELESRTGAFEYSIPNEDAIQDGMEGYMQAYKIWMDAAAEMYERASDAVQGEDVEPEAFRDIWLRSANEAFSGVMSTSGLAATNGQLVEQIREMQQEIDEMTQDWLAQIGMATRDDVGEIGQRISELERRQRTVEDELDRLIDTVENQ